MNKRGFTLIEVIGVVIVLSLILIVSVPSLTRTLKRNEQNKYNDYIDNLNIAAENYTIDRLQAGETFNDYMLFSIGDLIDAGYVKEIMTNPETNEKITRDYKIKVTKEADGTFKYELLQLPEEYQKVEYIASQGQQYINTEFNPTTKTKIVTNVKFETYKGYENDNSRLFSAINYTGDKNFAINFGRGEEQYNTLFIWVTKSYEQHLEEYFTLGWPVNSIIIDEETILNKNQIEMTCERLTYGSDTLELLITDDTKWPDNANTVDAPLYIFGGIYAEVGEVVDENNIVPFSIYQYMYVYDFKIYDNDVLVRDFVPCYRKSDNVIGLYDLINNQFYTNLGEGEFLKGENV